MPALDQSDPYREKVAMVCLAGGKMMGISGYGKYAEGGRGYEDRVLLWFNDPQTGSTLAMRLADITDVEAVQAHIARSRAKFSKEAIEKP